MKDQACRTIKLLGGKQGEKKSNGETQHFILGIYIPFWLGQAHCKTKNKTEINLASIRL